MVWPQLKTCCNVVWSSGEFMVLLCMQSSAVDKVGVAYHLLCHYVQKEQCMHVGPKMELD